jgi:putative tricarboxylic transport membrane protein
VLGFIFRKVDIPLAPLVLSLVLGGIMEQSFRQAMTISGGNPKIFVGSTICVVLVALSIFSIFLPLILDRIKKLNQRAKVEPA